MHVNGRVERPLFLSLHAEAGSINTCMYKYMRLKTKFKMCLSYDHTIEKFLEPTRGLGVESYRNPWKLMNSSQKSGLFQHPPFHTNDLGEG